MLDGLQVAESESALVQRLVARKTETLVGCSNVTTPLNVYMYAATNDALDR